MADPQCVDKLVFYANGRRVEVDNPDPELSLLEFLRRKLRLTGTKLGCAEGGCGACTVMVSRYDRTASRISHHSVNACLAPLCSMHGMAVTTVEGIGSIEKGLHPVQERIAKSHGTQCGFCTPGIVMSMYTLLRNNHKPSVADMESAFEGNLCRCTGYRPILDGFRTFAKQSLCLMGDQCCMNNTNNEKECGAEDTAKVSSPSQFAPYDPSQEAIFPSELQLSSALDAQRLLFSSSRVSWHRPTSLQEVVSIKQCHPAAKLVVGNTEVGVEVKFKGMHYPVLVDVSQVPELLVVEHTQDGISVGASTSLTKLSLILQEAIGNYPESQARAFSAVVEMLRWFAGHQIRNVASLAGNIMTASPISDLNPLLLAAGCVLTLQSKVNGERKLVMDGSFFQGYRKTAVLEEEVLVSVLLPFTAKNEYFAGYKQAHRKDDDIAIVNAGMRVLFHEKSKVIKDITMAFGGMAPITAIAWKTTKQLVGRSWDEDILHLACELLAEDLLLPAGSPGGMESYRSTLTTSFFFKFYLSVCLQLQQEQPDQIENDMPKNHISATSDQERDTSKSIQVYEEVCPDQSETDTVGRPLTHLSALKHASGEAVYVDDMPRLEDELCLGFVLSTMPHANILGVDAGEALLMPGVVDFIDHSNVPGSNVVGLFQDEEVFASKKVVAQGQLIGAILANTQMEAQRAAKAVKVQYEELEPLITIEQAIAAKSFFPFTKSITNGNVDDTMAACDNVIEGEVRTGAQEHFYLETQACIAIPREDMEMELFCSTQDFAYIQMQTAAVLGFPANRITVRVNRLGGGFGGKETRAAPLATVAAIAAHKHKRPVRCMLDRDEDMVMTSCRHPFLGKYKIGFNNDGQIQAAAIDFHSNCGYSLDLSASVMEKAIYHVENAYRVPNLRATGYLCKTNIQTSTAFRGFGGPQAMFVCETYITEIASKLGVRPEKIRETNMYKDGDHTHYKQILENCSVEKCWKQVISNSDVVSRRQQLQDFNTENRWKKRGMAVIPVKYGIAFGSLFLNQGGALVHIYTDGSVLLTHGGTEMGQGLHTKMIQVAGRVLQIPHEKIHISETSTKTVPNTSPTAGSTSSDLYGPAIMEACHTLMKRLQPYKSARPNDTWEEVVTAAYIDRVQLSATGFYKVPDIGYDWETNTGKPFSYFTDGAACSEVEIDCLTGHHTVLRTDIVMDVGRSLNPAIDIGQIEGAFVQGYGMFTLEEHRYSPSGYIYTRGPGMYKIPGFRDIPVELNVSLLKGASNPRAVYSSKAIGEPPLFLASSVFFAIKDAITAARSEVGLSDSFRLDSPATAEKIRMNCVDQFTKQFPPPEPGTYTPWYVQL